MKSDDELAKIGLKIGAYLNHEHLSVLEAEKLFLALINAGNEAIDKARSDGKHTIILTFSAPGKTREEALKALNVLLDESKRKLTNGIKIGM